MEEVLVESENGLITITDSEEILSRGTGIDAALIRDKLRIFANLFAHDDHVLLNKSIEEIRVECGLKISGETGVVFASAKSEGSIKISFLFK